MKRVRVQTGRDDDGEEMVTVVELLDLDGNALARIEGFADDETWYIYPKANTSTLRLIKPRNEKGEYKEEEEFQPFPLKGIVIESNETER